MRGGTGAGRRTDGIIILETGEVGGGIEGGEVELIGDADYVAGGVFCVWIWWHDGCFV